MDNLELIHQVSTERRNNFLTQFLKKNKKKIMQMPCLLMKRAKHN